MDFDATSVYPRTLRDEKSICRKIGRSYVFTPDMNIEIDEKFTAQTVLLDIAILKVLQPVRFDISKLTS